MFEDATKKREEVEATFHVEEDYPKDTAALDILEYRTLFVVGSQSANAFVLIFDGLHYGVSDFAYASSLIDMPMAPYPLDSSSTTLALSSSSIDLRPKVDVKSSKEKISTSQDTPLFSNGDVLGSRVPVTISSSF